MLIFRSARLRKDIQVNKRHLNKTMHSHSWDDTVGVVTFCRNSATPISAEEGLTGILSSGTDSDIKGYGDLSTFTEEEV